MENMWGGTVHDEEREPLAGGPQSPWTVERTSLLQKLWGQNKSINHIARVLGLSRGQVVGKLNRLKLLGNATSKFTPEADDLLRARWCAGVSQTSIAKAIGVSRQAISDRAVKLGLPPRRELNRTARQFKAARSSKSRPRRRFDFKMLFAGMADASGSSPIEQRKTFMELEPHHCRWPFGDPRDTDFYFCGATKIDGFSYCAKHLRMSMKVAA